MSWRDIGSSMVLPPDARSAISRRKLATRSCALLISKQDAILHAPQFAAGQREELLGDRGIAAGQRVSALRLTTSTLVSVIASADKVCSSANSSPKISPGR